MEAQVDSFDENVQDVKAQEAALLLRKHHDYGPGNIARSPGGPIMGLAVRLHDKVARLANLLESGEDPNYEALDDTALDLANYGTILSLVLRGDWPGVDQPRPAGNAGLNFGAPAAKPDIVWHYGHDTDRDEYLFGEDHPQWGALTADRKLPDTDPDWPPHPTLQGRVVASTAGVHGLVVGCSNTEQPGLVLLRHPMIRAATDGSWKPSEGKSDRAPAGHWQAAHVTAYNPTWEVGDRVLVAPWSDPDKAGTEAEVVRVYVYEDRSATVTARLDGRDHDCMFVATELLPVRNPDPEVEVEPSRFQVGDHVTPNVHWDRGVEILAVADATPDPDGDLTLHDTQGRERCYAPHELLSVERSLDGPYPVRAVHHSAWGDTDPCLVTGVTQSNPPNYLITIAGVEGCVTPKDRITLH